MRTNKQEFFKRHNVKQESLSKSEIAKISKIDLETIKKVYNRGVGAHKTNPKSVRTKSGKKDPNATITKKMSPEQWGMARVYSFVNKIEGRRKLNHDIDLT